MSDSSRHKIHSIAEVTYGTTPATPTMAYFRSTGTTLALTKDIIESEELRPDRQVADQRHGTKQVSGDLSAEVSYGSHDDFIEMALCGTWAAKAAPLTATTISALASDNSINFAANNAPLVEAGDVIQIAGFTGTAGNNQKGRVVSRTVSKIVLVTPNPLVDDLAGESVTITTLTDQLKAGVVRRSRSVLRNFTDMASNGFHLFTGVEVNRLDLSVAPNAISKLTFGAIGKGLSISSSAPAGSTLSNPNTNSPMDSFSGSLKEGGTVNGVVTELSQTLENGLEARFVIGSPETILPSIGRSRLTGQITVYFENGDMLNKFINETESSLDFVIGDVAGNRLRWFYPRVKYNGGQPDVSGQGAIPLNMPFVALYDAATATQLIVERSPKITA